MLITQPPKKLISAQDLSVNFVWTLSESEALEARYVRRVDEYFIVYLSSHTGCNQACRFCHLTATKQVAMQHTTYEDYLAQADTVLEYYDAVVASGKQPAAQVVHFNWMARGEPLLNPVMLHQHTELLAALQKRAAQRGLSVKFKISTIFPKATDLDAAPVRDLLSQRSVMTYYSLYSMDPEFRKRWIPKAHAPADVLRRIAHWQQEGFYPVDFALHWAFIAGENDSVKSVQDIVRAVEFYNVQAKFNLVRYNPFSTAQGQESSEDTLVDRFEMMQAVCDSQYTSRIVPRVGFDVKASCGLFVHPAEINTF